MLALSTQQLRMFTRLAIKPKPVGRRSFPDVTRPWDTARALERRGLAVVRPVPPSRLQEGWTVQLSPDWIELERLEKVVNRIEGTPLEITQKHQRNVKRLDHLYANFRKLEG